MSHPKRSKVTLEEALTEVMAQGGRFAHAQHVHLAWLAVKADANRAGATLCEWLEEIADRHGQPRRFHRTLTLAWASLVRHHVDNDSGTDDFTGFIRRNGGLLDKSLVDRHWSPEVLWSERGRQGWTDPDLQPLPA